MGGQLVGGAGRFEVARAFEEVAAYRLQAVVARQALLQRRQFVEAGARAAHHGDRDGTAQLGHRHRLGQALCHLRRRRHMVRQVAEKYDLILQEAVYINPRHDITDKVIRALNNVR